MCKLYRLFPDYTQVGNLLGGETIKIVWMGGMCEVTAGGKKKTTQKEKLYLVGIYLEIEMNAKCRFPPPSVVIPALSPNQTTLPRHKVSTWIITEAETHKSMKSMIVWLCARALGLCSSVPDPLSLCSCASARTWADFLSSGQVKETSVGRCQLLFCPGGETRQSFPHHKPVNVQYKAPLRL